MMNNSIVNNVVVASNKSNLDRRKFIALLSTTALTACFGGGGSLVTLQQQYVEYAGDRPKAEPYQLNPVIWSGVPGVGDKIEDINKTLKVLPLAYQASIALTDAVFSNAEFDLLADEASKAWVARIESGEFDNSNLDNIARAYNESINAIKSDPRYKQAEQNVIRRKKESDENMKKLSIDLLKEQFTTLFTPEALAGGSTPESMNMMEFMGAVSDETKVITGVLEQIANTLEGPALVAAAAVEKIILGVIKIGEYLTEIVRDAVTGAITLIADGVELVIDAVEGVVKLSGEVIGQTVEVARQVAEAIGSAAAFATNLHTSSVMASQKSHDASLKYYRTHQKLFLAQRSKWHNAMMTMPS